MNDRAAYQYLVESIRKFPNQRDFARMLRTAGLRGVSYTDFTLGVCAVHSGFKLPAARALVPEASPKIADSESPAAVAATPQ